MNRRDAIKRTALLTGYALSASALQGVLQGCRPEQKSPAKDWKPQYLTPDQGMQVAEIAERMLPRTDTPGAGDVFVHEYIDLIVKDCYKPEEQEMFKNGLREVDEKTMNVHKQAFLDCSQEQQLAILNEMDQTARQIVEENDELETEDFPFILRFKELALLGYFTSEEIGTNVLNYQPIPGKYNGCIPLEDVGRNWAL